jgi:threonine/homoserine/homoserine lactone efflux protein
MKKARAIVAVLFIVAGFGMIHGKSVTMEYISFALMVMGTGYLIWLIINTRSKSDNDEPEA